MIIILIQEKNWDRKVKWVVQDKKTPVPRKTETFIHWISICWDTTVCKVLWLPWWANHPLHLFSSSVYNLELSLTKAVDFFANRALWSWMRWSLILILIFNVMKGSWGWAIIKLLTHLLVGMRIWSILVLLDMESWVMAHGGGPVWFCPWSYRSSWEWADTSIHASFKLELVTVIPGRTKQKHFFLTWTWVQLVISCLKMMLLGLPVKAAYWTHSLHTAPSLNLTKCRAKRF